ncbi:MAG: IPT/TIG domain-containing protein [Candidatus Dormiibacterota bacterium]
MASTPAVASTPTQLGAFAGGGEQAAITAAGTGNPAVTTPADPSIAAGASDVVEAVNSAVFVYSRTGGLINSFGINTLIQSAGTSGWDVKDPHVAYDPSSGLFILMALQFNPASMVCGSQVVVLVSQSNPALPWSSRGSLSISAFLGTGLELANVSMALTGTLIIESSDYQTCGGSTSTPVASQTDIMQKADIMSGHTTTSSVVAIVPGPLGVQPVMGLGLTAVAYEIANDTNCSGPTANAFAVFRITGTPDTHNAAITCVLSAAEPSGSTVPPPAAQAGTATTLQTDDDRFLDAVWVNSVLWAAGNTGCTPAGDTHVRSCLNVVNAGASTTGTVTGGTQLSPEGVNGAYAYFPSVALDSTSDVFVTFDESSSSAAESMQVATISAGAFSSFIQLRQSTTFYSPAGCSNCSWGDYSDAVQDPLHPTDVWVVSSDDDLTGTSPNCATVNSCWDTYVGRYTFAAPSVSSLTPSSGTGAGGQLVTVAGSDFASGTTAVIGSTPITPGNLTPDSFTFTTPPGPPAGGVVHVVATDSLGSSSATSTGSGYLYVPLADYFPLSPYRILDTRAGSVHALGPKTTISLTVVGAGPVGVTHVPAGAVAVVLNITEVDGTAGSLLTVYPSGTVAPNASNLNFAPATVEANLVTVTLGTGGAVNIFNALGRVNVLADVEGYFAPPGSATTAGEFHPIPPVRVCDTRPKSATPACTAHGALVGGTPMAVNVTGGTIPSDGTAAAVVLNITGVSGTVSGYLSVFPTSSNGSCHVPGISTLNLLASTVVANRVMVALGPASTGGHTTSVCVFASSGKINVLLDASGWYGSATAPTGYEYQAIAPSRICDTRVASAGCTTGAIVAGFAGSRLVHVAGEGGVPGTGTVVQAVIANLTAIAPTAGTYMVAFPAGLLKQPGASDINLTAGEILPNLVVVQLDTTAGADLGCIELANGAGSVNAVLDIEGWFQ